MAEPVSFPNVSGFSGPRHWKIWAVAAMMTLIAAAGTWVAGQYRIGRLDAMLDRYEQPIVDFARAAERAKPGSIEADLLDGCKQAQIGTWLQTTDALEFVDPAAGNRVIVRLDPAKAQIDLNGREMAGCVSDEIENRQFDIGSMTNTWSMVLFLLSLGLGAWAWFGWEGWRQRQRVSAVATAQPGMEADAVQDAIVTEVTEPDDPAGDKPPSA